MLFKRTLKRKIQGSMFKTACITLLISLMLVLPLIYITIIPIAAFISESVNDSITQNYAMKFDADLRSSSKWEYDNTIDDLSVDEFSDLIYKNKTKTNIENNQLMVDMMLVEEEQSIIVESLDDHSKKRFMLSIITVLREIDDFIPLREYTDMDVILTEFRSEENIVFSVPQELEVDGLHGISRFEEMHKDTAVNGYIDKKLMTIYNDSKSTLTIYDEKDNVIGTIITAINPIFVFFIMTPIVVVFVISGFIALFVAMLMSKLLSIPILKPINVLNNQLSAIAMDDYAFSKDNYIDLKKPPKEIQNLRDNTNRIMKKMKSYYDDLEDYKDELEAQNAELEAQNIELSESKLVIETQRDKLVQSEKMASVGQLSAAIAHEINTPLGAIKSNCQMTETILPIIDMTLENSEDVKAQKAIKNLNSINSISLDASKRIIEIIRNLKNFSRLDQSDYQDADINEGIKSVLVLTSNLWKNKVEIIEDLDTLPMVPCYPGMLNQVFMNILVNAIYASDQDGVVNIKTQVNGEHLEIHFEDHGVGIPDKDLKQIFDSGFTTKEKNIGTGLGLSISKDIIERHKGTISVKSQVGVGTQFTVTLPLKQQQNNIE